VPYLRFPERAGLEENAIVRYTSADSRPQRGVKKRASQAADSEMCLCQGGHVAIVFNKDGCTEVFAQKSASIHAVPARLMETGSRLTIGSSDCAPEPVANGFSRAMGSGKLVAHFSERGQGLGGLLIPGPVPAQQLEQIPAAVCGSRN